MASVKTFLGDTIGRLLFREATVTHVRDVSPHFRRIQLQGDGLRGASVAAGDKIQLMLPGEGSRTYTPFGFDGARGSIELLSYVHGDGPGARWSRRAAAGDRVRLFGPRGSLPLASLAGPVVLFGDETSFALARALLDLRGGDADVSLVFEVSTEAEAALVLNDLAVGAPALVARTAGEAHLGAVEASVRAALQVRPGASLVLTGKAQSIQALRAAFKSRAAGEAGQKVKAYWSVGKRGLD